MKERTTWILGGGVAAVVIVGAVVALGRAAGRASAERAHRFALTCEAAGFEPRQCAFLAEMDRRSSDAADDAALANANAANASVQALMPR